MRWLIHSLVRLNIWKLEFYGDQRESASIDTGPAKVQQLGGQRFGISCISFDHSLRPCREERSASWKRKKVTWLYFSWFSFDQIRYRTEMTSFYESRDTVQINVSDVLLTSSHRTLMKKNKVTRLLTHEIGHCKNDDSTQLFNVHFKPWMNSLLLDIYRHRRYFECRLFLQYTDVWSFNVVLWETFSLGQSPFNTTNFVQSSAWGFADWLLESHQMPGSEGGPLSM